MAEKKKNRLHQTIAVVAIIAVAFGLGVVVGKKKPAHVSGSGGSSAADFQSMSSEERREMFSGGDHGGWTGSRDDFVRSRGTGFRGGSGMTVGEVLSIDEGSITIDLGEEGSKLVLLTDETSVLKSQDVGLEGLSEGDNVFVSGETSDGGSVIAETVTVQPEGFGTRAREVH